MKMLGRDSLVQCARCGRTIRLADTTEADLVLRSAMVEFFYCADRAYCDRNRRMTEQAREAARL